jgi:hypothetical protein
VPPGRGERPRLGSLVLGQNEDGGLRYCDNVGTGFTEAQIDSLLGALAPLRTETTPGARAQPALAFLQAPAGERRRRAPRRYEETRGFGSIVAGAARHTHRRS